MMRGRGRAASTRDGASCDEASQRRGRRQDEDRLELPEWAPVRSLSRRVLVPVTVFILLAFTAGTTVPFLLGWVGQQTFEALGLAGIFLANFIGSATLFLPVPGVTAAGQALIIAGAQTFPIPAVIVVGVLGMTLGETTAYLAGYAGRSATEDREVPLKGTRAGEWLLKAARFIERHMNRHGFITLVLVSAIPNPLFDVAGITAGAVRMNYLRFLLAVGIGDVIRASLLILLGEAFLRYTDFF